MAGPTVTHILHIAYAVSYGGTANGIVNVCNGLDANRFRSSIITLTPNGGFERNLDSRVALTRVLARRGPDPGLILRLARVIRKMGPDVVHTHAWGTLCEGIAAAWLSGVHAIVHSEHGTVEARPLQRVVQRWVWARASDVVAVSETLRERMCRIVGYPPERVRVIRNGVDVDRYRYNAEARARIRAALGVPEDAWVVGAIGRLHAVKGHRFFIEAAARLDRAIHVWVVGDGERHAELRSFAARGSCGARVQLLGHRTNVPELLSAIDVLCQPSLGEGISNTVLEAMACSRPIVATSVGGNLETVVPGETGLLVEPGRADALADAISRLARDRPLSRRLGEAGRARAIEHFSMKRMIADYSELYASVARARGRRRS